MLMLKKRGISEKTIGYPSELNFTNKLLSDLNNRIL